jgi:hypothetical protein
MFVSGGQAIMARPERTRRPFAMHEEFAAFIIHRAFLNLARIM